MFADDEGAPVIEDAKFEDDKVKLKKYDDARYNYFVEHIIDELVKDEYQEPMPGATQKVREVLEKYFSDHQLSVYIYLHKYYYTEPVKDPSDMIKTVGPAVTSLVKYYYDESEQGVDVSDEQYQQIRRITKFYENLTSVENVLKQEVAREGIISLNKCLNQEYEELKEQTKKTKRAINKLDEDINGDDGLKKQLSTYEKDVLLSLFTLISVFSAAIFAVLLSTGLLNSLVTTAFSFKEKPSLTVFILSIALLLLFDLLYFFFSFIASIIFKDSDDKKDRIGKFNKLILVVNISLLIIIVISLCFILKAPVIAHGCPW